MSGHITKYTADGKKVAVVGKLNNSEHIVQEIFVSDGAEIPLGESFVVRTLLDAPAVSWKDKNLADSEKNFERRKAEITRESERLERSARLAHEKAAARIRALTEFCKEDQPSEVFDTLIDFMAGRITHVAILDYRPSIASIDDDGMFSIFDGRVDGLKLISIFGSGYGAAARLDYRVNQYKDGSGSSWVTVVPCRSEAEAAKALQDRYTEICNAFVSDPERYSSIWEWSKHPVLVTTEAAGKLMKERRVAALEKNLNEAKQKLAEHELELAVLLEQAT